MTLDGKSISLSGVVRWIPARAQALAPAPPPPTRWLPHLLAGAGLSIVAANALRLKRRPV
jgi:hypothetical protein